MLESEEQGTRQSAPSPVIRASLGVTVPSLQYGVPVIKYDRRGFKMRQRKLIFTQKAAYVVELAKIKQKIEYPTLKGRKQVILR